jgi:hypothetical protein
VPQLAHCIKAPSKLEHLFDGHMHSSCLGSTRLQKSDSICCVIERLQTLNDVLEVPVDNMSYLSVRNMFLNPIWDFPNSETRFFGVPVDDFLHETQNHWN